MTSEGDLDFFAARGGGQGGGSGNGRASWWGPRGEKGTKSWKNAWHKCAAIFVASEESLESDLAVALELSGEESNAHAAAGWRDCAAYVESRVRDGASDDLIRRDLGSIMSVYRDQSPASRSGVRRPKVNRTGAR